MQPTESRAHWLARKMWEFKVWAGPIGLLTVAAAYDPKWAPFGDRPTFGELMLVVAGLFCLIVAYRSSAYERTARELASGVCDQSPA